uniref:Uncharacterized protein n=1 Tax=Candidatus Kentrum eta TaxID=2126337 RepID=A0A450V810_9GAMM|nr:MAG: hypothetical protein BECKH772A_GA0070896_100575 [Candidatus Kentron sp. H]VFJ94299.1 MAG: hypothetical protein BECKH772B_GA0070898_100594 [Candidatus Kentron sp. H]VFK00910.1 MAG: hypothetical protein BECKH772C_GA0070978_100555 [Candidatus Kentron sp. H]
MQTIAFDAAIDKDGMIRLPSEYREACGREARFVVLLPGDNSETNHTAIDENDGALDSTSHMQSNDFERLSDESKGVWKTVDLRKYSGTIDWPVDGMEYQKQCRDEWE